MKTLSTYRAFTWKKALYSPLEKGTCCILPNKAMKQIQAVIPTEGARGCAPQWRNLNLSVTGSSIGEDEIPPLHPLTPKDSGRDDSIHEVTLSIQERHVLILALTTHANYI